MSLEFHLFNYGSYPDIPLNDEVENTSYIDLPNEHFDPVRGKWYLDSYLDTLVFGEKLGFDGIHTTTQMGGPVGMTPTANLTAAYLAAKTERIKIGTLGPILNVFQNPMRAAEEIALLDQLSGGRLIVGLPMGHGMNYHTAATMNPAFARERYWESHDLMRKAFTEPGPFEWQGEHFHVPYANLWPKPLQQPYPEVWIPAAGSKLTLEKCAEFHYTYQALFSPRRVLKRNVETFRQAAEKFGYTPGPDQVAAVVFIHVAETDAQARLEAEHHLLFLMQNINRSRQPDAFPPGHFSVESLRGFMTKGGYRDRDIGDMAFEEMMEEGWAIVGSPQTVVDRLGLLSDELGAGKLIHVADFGAMPNWLIRKSLTLMAEEVIPHFRGPGGKPVWAEDDLRTAPTHAEYGALRTEALSPPKARIPGLGVVDVRTAHVEELRKPLRA
ncbi:LLM class flavin-dependent oxidoreductase [Actinomadura rubrisoli]|uniref:LLM class flavin-dependent oxidoreductase n=1 Tax=Actinomadura rubrisoli TaxID=2530368 RepID=A0A4R5BDJ1_9ACTN|nr:LLM class flavin-dependent oxidoreductase [Actinomadura rubrisoli]TDD82846.1 LLM class flavin-dependent oxidoreductase [Actinomadura rubrisoli]